MSQYTPGKIARCHIQRTLNLHHDTDRLHCHRVFRLTACWAAKQEFGPDPFRSLLRALPIHDTKSAAARCQKHKRRGAEAKKHAEE